MYKVALNRSSIRTVLFAIFTAMLLASCGGSNEDVAHNRVNPADQGQFSAVTATVIWTPCASEWSLCSFSGTQQVRYGGDNTYVYKTATDSIQCNNAVFGDPLPGGVKTCEYSGSAPPLTETWTACGAEWSLCSFSDTRQVRYGGNNVYFYKTATGSIQCNNAVFGDPLPGGEKSCEYSGAPSTLPPPPPPPPTGTWTACGAEWSLCSFSGTRQIRYGGNNVYFYKTATGSIQCNNAVFGDPLPGSEKSCEYSDFEVTTNPPPVVTPPSPTTAAMTMICVGGSTYQCSGTSIIRSDNGVALTRSGVQAYGKSTNDLANPIADPTTAFGLALTSGGLAELRLAKDGNSIVSSPTMVLSSLGITWDGKVPRPTIVETFKTTAGFVTLDTTGAITSGSLPSSSNLNYYDYATKGPAATQANYANNQYFPRSDPPRCSQPCPFPDPAIETTGMQYVPGNWHTGASTIADMAAADMTTAIRVHEDGDVHAGDGIPDPITGARINLPGGTGPGVPAAGTKGIRELVNWSFRYGNLGAWLTKDTVFINEWGPTNEHNQNRRGLVAFGDVSNPSTVPTTGTATYAGFVYGWYAPNATAEASLFRGDATISVNFVTRAVVVAVTNTLAQTEPGGSYQVAIPVSFNATTAMGTAGQTVANYLTGLVDNGTLKGGLSGRYFGPVVSSGTSGAGPAEIGGALSLSNAASGQTVVAGFIGRKQ